MAIYLDCAATTPLDSRVRAEMLRYLDEEFGNAGSRTHSWGLRARAALERARDQVAAVAGEPAMTSLIAGKPSLIHLASAKAPGASASASTASTG